MDLYEIITDHLEHHQYIIDYCKNNGREPLPTSVMLRRRYFCELTLFRYIIKKDYKNSKVWLDKLKGYCMEFIDFLEENVEKTDLITISRDKQSQKTDKAGDNVYLSMCNEIKEAVEFFDNLVSMLEN